jgi:FkbM family methyltransferase
MRMKIYRCVTRPFIGRGIENYPFMIRLHERFMSLSQSKYIDINGYKLYASKGDMPLLQYYGCYEPITTNLLSKIIKKGDSVVDVGANVGYYTLLFSNLVGPSGKVYAFEPDPINFDHLKKNIELNKATNIIAEQKAVSSHSGIVKLFLHGTDNVSHTIVKDVYKGSKCIDVESVILHEYFDGINIDFVKIDAEGADDEIIYSMIKGLFNTKILFEYNPDILSKKSKYPTKLLDYLFNLNYRLTVIDEKNKTTKAIMRIDKYSSNEVVNILCERDIVNIDIPEGKIKENKDG